MKKMEEKRRHRSSALTEKIPLLLAFPPRVHLCNSALLLIKSHFPSNRHYYITTVEGKKSTTLPLSFSEL